MTVILFFFIKNCTPLLMPSATPRLRLMTASTAARADSAATSPNAPALVAEGRQKLWRWFLGATLAVVLLETLVAARTRRAVSPVEGVTP